MDKKTWIIGILIGAIVEFLILSFLATLWVYNAKQAVVTEYELKIANAKIVAEKTTNEIMQGHQQIDKQQKAKIAALSAERDNLLGWVSKRPSRNDATPENRGPITGAELPREDAEFLVGEAARAERIRIERDDYYEKYELARERLGGSEGSNERHDGEKAN